MEIEILINPSWKISFLYLYDTMTFTWALSHRSNTQHPLLYVTASKPILNSDSFSYKLHDVKTSPSNYDEWWHRVESQFHFNEAQILKFIVIFQTQTSFFIRIYVFWRQYCTLPYVQNIHAKSFFHPFSTPFRFSKCDIGRTLYFYKLASRPLREALFETLIWYNKLSFYLNATIKKEKKIEEKTVGILYTVSAIASVT